MSSQQVKSQLLKEILNKLSNEWEGSIKRANKKQIELKKGRNTSLWNESVDTAYNIEDPSQQNIKATINQITKQKREKL